MIRQRWGVRLRLAWSILRAREHIYLSTGCLHGDHTYCQSMTGLNGAKRPARCKHCDAPCRCPCHRSGICEPER